MVSESVFLASILYDLSVEKLKHTIGIVSAVSGV